MTTPHDKLTEARKSLDTILENYDTATKRLRDARRGEPGSSFASGGGSGGRSPVETSLGLNSPGDDPTWTITADKAGAALDAVQKLVARIAASTETLHRIISAEVPSAPTDKQRREVERANTEDPDRGFCEHCTKHRPKGMAEDIYRTGTVSGNLDEPMGLCRFDYETVLRKGRLSTLDEIRLNVKRLQRVT